MTNEEIDRILLQHDEVLRARRREGVSDFNSELISSLDLTNELLAEIAKRLQAPDQATIFYETDSNLKDQDRCLHLVWDDLEHGIGQCVKCMAMLRYNRLAPGGKRS